MTTIQQQLSRNLAYYFWFRFDQATQKYDEMVMTPRLRLRAEAMGKAQGRRFRRLIRLNSGRKGK